MDHVRVGEVLALQRRAVVVEPDTEYRLIGVYSFGKGIFHREPKLGSDLGNYRYFAIEPKDLILSNIQAWEGAVAVASHRDARAIGTHRFLSYVPTTDRISTKWARWFFLSERGMDLIRQAAPGTTIRNRTLAIDRFEALEIPLPPIGEQLQQVAHLEAVSATANQATDSFGRQKYADMIALLPGLVDVVVSRAAAGKSKVGSLVDFVTDAVHPGDDPGAANSFVGLQYIESHTGRCIGSDDLGPMKGRKFRFRPGDILYGYLRPYLNKVWVADRDGLCSVDQYVLRPCSNVDAKLLAYSLRGRDILSQVINLTHSLQLPRLRSGLLASLEVPTVSADSATSIGLLLDRVQDRLVAAATGRRRQDKLAAALVPSALNEVFRRLS